MCSCQRTKMARVLLEGVEIGNKRGGRRRERGPGGVGNEGGKGGVYDCTRVAYDDMRHESVRIRMRIYYSDELNGCCCGESQQSNHFAARKDPTTMSVK